jgi:superoxide dismutase, Fe-Mn family
MDSRRKFIKKTALLSLSGLAANMISNEKLEAIEKLGAESFLLEPFKLAPLPYAYDALEPFIDKQTMELHHDKHHQAYVDNLNKFIDSRKMQMPSDIVSLCKEISNDSLPALRNNAGGHYNHDLFWILMKENKDAKPNIPTGKLAEAITSNFSSFEEFKKQFSEAGMKRFGSGWAWLVLEKGKLKICSTANQDNPLMSFSEVKGSPVLALDVWEHAYYLKYQNKRADYINNWWNVVNWEKASDLFDKA